MQPLVAVPATFALVYRAYSRNSLTPLAIGTAAITAIIHALHPSAAPFTFLVVFFLGGTKATKVKHGIKAQYTLSSGGSGASGGDGPRTPVQVLANSVVASFLILIDLLMQWRGQKGQECLDYSATDGMFLVGITANYAAVAADTFSSELGILATSSPRLITSPTLRKVPRGTNGGVTFEGVCAGALGAFTIGITSLFLLPFCSKAVIDPVWTWQHKTVWLFAVTLWGVLGSLLDSILGGLLQATVVDKRTGKVVENGGGGKVLVNPGSMSSTGLDDVSNRGRSRVHAAEDVANTIAPRRTRSEYDPLASGPELDPKLNPQKSSRSINSGHDILSNNGVNLLMASLMSVGAMVVMRLFAA